MSHNFSLVNLTREINVLANGSVYIDGIVSGYVVRMTVNQSAPFKQRLQIEIDLDETLAAFPPVKTVKVKTRPDSLKITRHPSTGKINVITDKEQKELLNEIEKQKKFNRFFDNFLPADVSGDPKT